MAEGACGGIGNLRVEQIEEIRRLRKPPDAVRRTLEVTCLILEAAEPSRGSPKPPSWEAVKRLLGDETFLPRMMSYDYGSLREAPQLVTLLRDQYFGNSGVCASVAPVRKGRPAQAQEPLLHEKVLRASQAAGALFAWCTEVLAFVDTPREVRATNPTSKSLEASAEKRGTKASPRVAQAEPSSGASPSNAKAAKQSWARESSGGLSGLARNPSLGAAGGRDNLAKAGVLTDTKQKRGDSQTRASVSASASAPSNPSSRPPSARAPALQAGAMAGLRPREPFPPGLRKPGLDPADAKVSALADLRQRFTELPPAPGAGLASTASSMPALPTRIQAASSQGGAKVGSRACLASALAEAKSRDAEVSGPAQRSGSVAQAMALPLESMPGSSTAQVATFEAFAKFAAGDAKITRAPADVLRSVVGAIWRRRSLRVHISASLGPGEPPRLAEERLQAICEFLANNGIKGFATSVVGASGGGSGALCELLLSDDKGLQERFRRGGPGGDSTPRTMEAIEYLEENFKLCYRPGDYT